MKTSVKIVNGKHGWHLRIDGFYISNIDGIKSIESSKSGGVPYGSTEWVSITALRRFWNDYQAHILASTVRPYASVWGQLIPIPKKGEGSTGAPIPYMEACAQIPGFSNLG